MAEWLLAKEFPVWILSGAAWCGAGGLLSAAATFVLIHWAGRLGVIDEPNARSSHKRPTPRGGGIAIIAAGLLAVVTLLAVGVVPPPRSGWVLLGAIVVAVVSVVDDVSSMSPRLRLLVHLAAAGLAVFATGPAEIIDLESLGAFYFGPASWVLGILWILGMTNAFNFMDGIDGIAGMTALAALGVLSGGLAMAGNPFVAFVAGALAAASAGFLIWNWQPARIFMGDVGSAFLGYTIAVLPLMAGPSTSRWLLPVTALVMWPFLFDTIYTLVRRLAKRENVFEAHRSHLYQRLVIAGWSHSTVSMLYGVLSLVAGSTALMSRGQLGIGHVAEFVAVGTAVVGALGLVTLVQVSEARVASVAE